MPSNNNNKPSTPPRSSRRSARVHHHDPIVAPGFGTAKDLEKLARELSAESDTNLPQSVVEAIMRSRGRGVQEKEEAAAAAPVNVWADFMKEEGMEQAASSTTAETEKGSRRSAKKKAPAAASSNGDNRVYMLPLAKRPKKKAKSTQAGGILVQSGTLDSSLVGRTKFKDAAVWHLPVPTRILGNIPIRKVFTSSTAVHSIAIDTAGTAYGWGRNESNQLGPDMPSNVVLPQALSVGKVESAACGKAHTIFHLQDGTLWAVGANKVGQCGVRNFVDVPNYRKCALPDDLEIYQIACGEDFSVALSVDGFVYTTGSSEFGQLGNGETGEYFVSANKLAFANCNVFTKRSDFYHAPNEKLHVNNEKTPVVKLDDLDIRIGSIAVGKHHTVAVEASCENGTRSRVFSWGSGNYGTLGHGVQADEYYPRLIGILAKLPIPDGPMQVSAGATCSLLRTNNGHIYYWGKHRSVGEATMRPSVVDALANNGHNVTQFGAGGQTVVCSTSNGQTVAWGQGPHGELGLETAKSSSKPTFVTKLDKCLVTDLACGYGHTLYVLRNEDSEDKAAVKKLSSVTEKDVEALFNAKSSGKKRG